MRRPRAMPGASSRYGVSPGSAVEDDGAPDPAALERVQELSLARVEQVPLAGHRLAVVLGVAGKAIGEIQIPALVGCAVLVREGKHRAARAHVAPRGDPRGADQQKAGQGPLDGGPELCVSPSPAICRFGTDPSSLPPLYRPHPGVA